MKSEPGKSIFGCPMPATVARVLLIGVASVALSACAVGQPPAPATDAVPAETQVTPTADLLSEASAVVAETQITLAEALPAEVIVYASDLPESALTDELAFWDAPDSPGGKMIGIPNTGDELDPPPENDPSVTLQVQVQSGIPYRCWIHMAVGPPKGKSQANVLWAQFSDAVDKEGSEIYRPGTGSYLTAHGPEQEGWTWVGCDPPDGSSPPVVYFGTSGPVAVRLQAGMEGVGFDQFVLSPARFLEQAPSGAVVDR